MKIRHWIILVIGIVITLPYHAPEGMAAPSPNEVTVAKIRAAYLLNFIRFTAWPEETFESDSSPITVTVIGEDTFGSILDDTFKSKTIEQVLTPHG